MSDTDKPNNDVTGNGSAENPADLAGAYALNALTAEEAAAYERYLARSEQARAPNPLILNDFAYPEISEEAAYRRQRWPLRPADLGTD